MADQRLGCIGVKGILVGIVIAGGCTAGSAPNAVPVVDERTARPLAVAPIVEMRALLEAPGTNASPDTGLALAANVSTDARLLVISADGTSAALGAIAMTLDYLGTPYDVLNATTGPTLTADMLSSGTHGKYHGIFLDTGDLPTSAGSAFSSDEWMTLASYETTFGVRRVSLYTSPTASYGLSGSASIDPAQTPISAHCTAAGAAVFVGANCARPVTINLGWAYPAQPTDSATIPLLADAAGNVYAATRSHSGGRETLALTFAQASYAVFSLQLAYGLVHWVTHGLFVGERHVYASPQIDDLFLASTIYTGGTYRITDADLQALADWQNRRKAEPVTANLRLAWAANGAGSAAIANDRLTAKAVALGPTFAWMSHTWDHAILDGLSYADVLTEFTRNDQYLRGLGLVPYATANAVTPGVSGLASPAAMQAMFDAGIRQIVSDTSMQGQKNPSPNAGIYNALSPGVLEIPRRASELYFNVSQPSEWISEYNVIQSKTATYGDLITSQSDALLRYLLRGENDPWMFHQANTRDNGGGHSLLSDLLDATLDKYLAVATFAIVSPTMDDLAGRVANRMKLNASGVSATIAPGSRLTVQVVNAATVPVTGLCTPGAESYAGQTISYLHLAAGQSVTLSLTGCNPTGGTGGGGGRASGPAGGASGTTDAGTDGPGTKDMSGCSCEVAGPRSGTSLLFIGVLAVVVGWCRRPTRRSGRNGGPTTRPSVTGRRSWNHNERDEAVHAGRFRSVVADRAAERPGR